MYPEGSSCAVPKVRAGLPGGLQQSTGKEGGEIKKISDRASRYGVRFTTPLHKKKNIWKRGVMF